MFIRFIFLLKYLVIKSKRTWWLYLHMYLHIKNKIDAGRTRCTSVFICL